MLVELRIRDYAVVEDLTLQLGPGLNVLTGETGAGKSIIVGALSLLLGERASSDVVRAGAERASVEAVFDVAGVPAIGERLESYGFRPEDDLLILRREVAAAGRNRAWVCGSPTTATIVGELGALLVDLHGQHEHQTLLRAHEQRSILDAYAGATGLAAEVAERYDGLRSLEAELESREEHLRDVESRSDFLRFQLAEIDGAELRPGEDVDLEGEIGRLEHGEELQQGAGRLYEILYGGDEALADLLADARRRTERLAEYDPGLADLARRLDEAWHAVADAGRELGGYAEAVDHDPERLGRVRERLDRIFRLKRKYGPELADVLETAQRVRGELEDLDGADRDLGVLRKEIAAARSGLAEVAVRLGDRRREAAGALSAAVGEVLPALGLGEGAFEVRVTAHDDIGPAGSESVRFLLAPNPGFDPLPLGRIASGGELSRVMLALKSVLTTADPVPVLVFDEIDAGIGGTVATAVADKLATVAGAHQVFVVTHLAQVASRARTHLLVDKDVTGRVGTSHVRALGGEDRVAEIARMLGGDPDSVVSREHAREMLSPVSG